MSKKSPDESSVIEALESVPGSRAITPRQRHVKKWMQSNQSHLKIKGLISRYGLENVSRIATVVLQRNVAGPSKDMSETVGETNTAMLKPKTKDCNVRSEKNASDFDHGEGSEKISTANARLVGERARIDERDGKRSRNDDTTNLLRADQSLLSLPPIQVSCSSQHAILSELQRTLEESLYEFGKAVIHKKITSKGWECSRCVELNDWVKVLRRHRDLLSREEVEKLDRPVETLLNSIVQIRHTSVHRQKLTTCQVMAFLFDAETFLKLLDDHTSCLRISELRSQLSTILNDLSEQKESIRRRLLEIASSFSARRGETDLEEHLAVDTALQEAEERRNRSIAHIDRLTCEAPRVASPTGSKSFEHPKCGEEDGSHANELAVLLCSSCVHDWCISHSHTARPQK